MCIITCVLCTKPELSRYGNYPICHALNDPSSALLLNGLINLLIFFAENEVSTTLLWCSYFVYKNSKQVFVLLIHIKCTLSFLYLYFLIITYQLLSFLTLQFNCNLSQILVSHLKFTLVSTEASMWRLKRHMTQCVGSAKWLGRVAIFSFCIAINSILLNKTKKKRNLKKGKKKARKTHIKKRKEERKKQWKKEGNWEGKNEKS